MEKKTIHYDFKAIEQRIRRSSIFPVRVSFAERLLIPIGRHPKLTILVRQVRGRMACCNRFVTRLDERKSLFIEQWRPKSPLVIRMERYETLLGLQIRLFRKSLSFQLLFLEYFVGLLRVAVPFSRIWQYAFRLLRVELRQPREGIKNKNTIPFFLLAGNEISQR